MNVRSVEVRLDPSTRRLLSQTGHDIAGWSDQQLAAVEYTARALQEGERVFVPESMAPLVDELVSSRPSAR